MPQIRPIKDLRNTAEISEICHTTDEPVFITKNGYNDMVIMSNDAYERDIAMSEIYRKLLLGKTQIENGNVVPAAYVFAELHERYDYDV